MIARFSSAARRPHPVPFLRDMLALLAGVTLGAGLLFGGSIVHAERHRPIGCHSCASRGIVPT